MAAPLPQAPSKTRQRLMTSIKVIGLAVLVGVVISRFDIQVAMASWRGVSWPTAAAILLIFLISMTLRVAKWSWQASKVGLRFDPLNMARNYMIGVLLGVVTPMRVGEFYRLAAIDWRPEAVGERALAVASLVLEKVYELLTILCLVTTGLFFSFHAPGPGAALGALCALGLVYGLGSTQPPAWAKAILPKILWQKMVEPMLNARDTLDGGTRVGLMGLTLTGHLLNLGGGLMIFRLFGDISAVDFFLRLPVIALVNAVPITISGIGLRELGAMELFGPLGFPESGAAAAAALLFVCINIIPLVALGPVIALQAMGGRGHPPSSSEDTP